MICWPALWVYYVLSIVLRIKLIYMYTYYFNCLNNHVGWNSYDYYPPHLIDDEIELHKDWMYWGQQLV